MTQAELNKLLRGFAEKYPGMTIGEARDYESFTLNTLEDLEMLPEKVYLLDKILVGAGLTILAGPGDVGKSFAAIAWSCCVATGTAWHGHEAKDPGPVVYITPEGVRSLAVRFRAWEAMTGKKVDGRVRTITQAVSAFDQRSVAKLHRTLDRLCRIEGAPRLVVIDTLARSFDGGDENSAADMSHFISVLGEIQRKYGCAVLVNHHFGNVGERGRGSSALKPSSDVYLTLKDKGKHAVLKFDRIKDDEPQKDETYYLERYAQSVALVPVVADPIVELRAIIERANQLPGPDQPRTGNQLIRELGGSRDKNLEAIRYGLQNGLFEHGVVRSP